MKIRWDNLIVFILLAVGLSLFARYRGQIALFASNMERIGPNHSSDEQTLGLIALGLVGACIVAIVRIVARK